MKDEDRARFEKWIKSKGGDFIDVSRQGNGEYNYGPTRTYLRGWEAGIKSREQSDLTIDGEQRNES